MHANFIHNQKSVTMKHLETSVSEKDSAFQRSLREWQNRAEVAEKRVTETFNQYMWKTYLLNLSEVKTIL